MYCSRYKRKCQCTPRPRMNRAYGAEGVYPFFQFASFFLQHSRIKAYLFQNRAKRQKHIGLLALFFWLFKSDNNTEVIL